MTSDTDKGECYCCQAEVPTSELKDVASYYRHRLKDGEEYMVCPICWTGWTVNAAVHGGGSYGPPQVYQQMSVYTRMVLERLDDLEKKVDELLFRARFPGYEGPWSIHAYPGGDDEQ